MVDPLAWGFGLHVGAEANFYQHEFTFPTMCGDGASFSFWEADESSHGRFRDSHPQLYALALDLGATVRTVWDAGWFPSLPSTLGPAIRRPLSFAYISRPTSVVREGSRRLGVARQPILSPSRLPSLSRLGELFGFGYAPQMLSSPMEVSNPAKDKVVRVVAPTPEADDSFPPAMVLPGRPGGLSSVCRSSRRLLPAFLQVSGRTDCMAGNTYEGLVTSTADSFWQSISGGPFRRASEWQSIFATLWAIWLHQNEVVFRGRPPSADAIQHDLRGLTYFRNRGGLGLSSFRLL